MVQTAGTLAQPGSPVGILKAIVSPEPSALAWVSAQRSENAVGWQGAARSAVVVTVSVVAACARNVGAPAIAISRANTTIVNHRFDCNMVCSSRIGPSEGVTGTWNQPSRLAWLPQGIRDGLQGAALA